VHDLSGPGRQCEWPTEPDPLQRLPFEQGRNPERSLAERVSFGHLRNATTSSPRRFVRAAGYAGPIAIHFDLWLNSEVANDEPVFRALADPTRRQILQDLRTGERTAGDIASRFTISAPSISRHLALLKTAGLVEERREANRIYYSLVEERLALCLNDFMSAVCPEQIVLRARRIRRERSQ
jgi:DNA-binding transcriptional ArsR family regulator